MIRDQKGKACDYVEGDGRKDRLKEESQTGKTWKRFPAKPWKSFRAFKCVLCRAYPFDRPACL